VSSVDAIIEQLFAALKQKGYLENSIVAIWPITAKDWATQRSGLGHITHLHHEFINIPMCFTTMLMKSTAILKFATRSTWRRHCRSFRAPDSCIVARPIFAEAEIEEFMFIKPDFRIHGRRSVSHRSGHL